jgi:FAD:protein FMN transferase
MKQLKIIMDMPITVEIIDQNVSEKDFHEVFNYFKYIDNTFSVYKPESEISQINLGKLPQSKWSKDMQTIFSKAKTTKEETSGYFDIFYQGKYDPSGVVKGWAIENVAKLLNQKGFKNYYIDAGGDICAVGKNSQNKPWRIGIRNPFNRFENVKVLEIANKGVATSGTYIRGQHIYNPIKPKEKITDIVSLTVIGPNIFDADRFATAAFAMGKNGINFIEKLAGFAGYMIDKDKIATYTNNFNNYVSKTS